jgi:hypothetical protein
MLPGDYSDCIVNLVGDDIVKAHPASPRLRLGIAVIAITTSALWGLRAPLPQTRDLYSCEVSTRLHRQSRPWTDGLVAMVVMMVTILRHKGLLVRLRGPDCTHSSRQTQVTRPAPRHCVHAVLKTKYT